MEELALELKSLNAGYGRFDVLHDVSLTIAPGEAVALLGPNGAGKSTLLRSIMGLIRHRRGEILIAGTDVSKMRSHDIARGRAALVPEGRRLFPNLSVADNLSVGAMRFRHDATKTDELLQKVFELFPVVERHQSRLATSLSGGEQQMVAIGRMMMNDPQLMLLDEPSLGLAPLAIRDMTASLKKLRELGHSLLLVEQRVDIALEVCDRIYILSDGKIIDEKRSDELGEGGHALIDQYLG